MRRDGELLTTTDGVGYVDRTLSTTSVEISWSGTERPGVSYLLDRRIDSGLSFQIDEQEPPTVVVEGTTYVDEGVTPGRRYRYFVVALDAEGRRSEPGRAFGSTLPEGQRFALGTLLTSPEAGFVVDGGVFAEALGGAITFAGDLNGDGADEILLAADPTVAAGPASDSFFIVYGGPEVSRSVTAHMPS